MSTFDGETLLQQQSNLLLSSLPADISFINFLRIRLNAQQKLTTQRNKWQKKLESKGIAAPLEEGRTAKAALGEVGQSSQPGIVVDRELHLETPAAEQGSERPNTSLDERPAVASGKVDTFNDERFREIRLEECPYCARKFSAARVEKHVAICSKQSQKEESRESMRKSQRMDKSQDSATPLLKTRPKK